MRAFVLTGHGGPEKLVFESAWPVPELRAGEVLIEVSACGMNNTDVNTRVGWYSKQAVPGAAAGGGGSASVDADGGWTAALEFPRIQGADICGLVVAVAPDVTDDLLGQRVLVDPWLRDWNAPFDLERCGFLGSERDGGFAEYLSVPARHVHAIDSALSDVELASFATASITAANMLDRAGVAEGERVLVTGASGGVGSALVQLARSKGARPVAICAREKFDGVRELGAVAAIARGEQDLRSAVKETTGRETVDVVLDVVGGPGWSLLIDVLRRGGRYCASGAIAGPVVELDLRTLYLNDLVFYGATVPPPHLFGELVEAIATGAIKPVVAASFPLAQLQAAQEMFAAKRDVGNIVIDMRR
jgi:NADPH:quinone reductase-like Zn-dependent oxidoreductase